MASQHPLPPSGFVRMPDDHAGHALTTAQALTVAATGDDTGGATGVIEEVVAPGGGPPLHVHHAADELFYVLSGRFAFRIGALHATGGAGTVAFAPAGFERFLVELSALPVESLTMESVNAMAAGYQTTYVGPPLAAEPE